FLLRADRVTRLRRGGGDDASPRRLGDPAWPGSSLQGEHVRHQPTGVLLDQRRVAFRQQAAVQRIADVDGPGLMEIMEQVRIDAGPIVDRHNCFLRGPTNGEGHYTPRTAAASTE